MWCNAVCRNYEYDHGISYHNSSDIAINISNTWFLQDIGKNKRWLIDLLQKTQLHTDIIYQAIKQFRR